MVRVILAIIGLVLLIIGFFTHWIVILLGAILLIIGVVTLYRKLKRRRLASLETGDEIRIESTVNLSRQTTIDTGSTQKLNRLAELRKAGILTDEEYERKKNQIERETAPAEKPVPDTASEEKIKKLTKLRDEGILTDEEYEQKKSQIERETTPAKEPIAETTPAEEPVPETAPAEESIPENAPAEKPVPDTASEEKIKKLADLRDQGILTDEEYEQKKSQILQETASATETAPETTPTEKIEPDAASAEKIKKLAELRDQGILTDEEYEQKKAQILQDSA